MPPPAAKWRWPSSIPLQYLSDDDLNAMAAFLKGMDGARAGHPRAGRHAWPPRCPGGPGRRRAGHSQAVDCRLARHAPGRACTWITAPATSSRARARPRSSLQLQGSAVVLGRDAGPLLSIILNGTAVPSTGRRPMRLAMQGYADRLSDGGSGHAGQLRAFRLGKPGQRGYVRGGGRRPFGRHALSWRRSEPADPSIGRRRRAPAGSATRRRRTVLPGRARPSAAAAPG